MKRTSISMAAMATLFSVSAFAANKALPLGIDLGTTTCSEISKAKTTEWSLVNPGISAWSDGPMLKSTQPNIPGLENATNLMIICDSQDRSIHVSLTIPKSSVQQIAKELDNKYKTIQRKLPNLGDGKAKWTAANASIGIDYVHVSFTATLSYETNEATKLWTSYAKAQAKKKEQGAASQL